ncbi:hypothetical protein B0H13DRAFT_2307844 [Mycena leptocephala]|nr:hypothetical protein B0H13DRAFT_2307844 [Mycena leptocephala]
MSSLMMIAAEYRESIGASIYLIVALLNDNEYVRRAGADALSKLSEQAEYRESIGASIPRIVALLTASHWAVRGTGENALSKLSEQAEFRQSIGASIPQIVAPLSASQREVRMAGENALLKLSEQADLCPSLRLSAIHHHFLVLLINADLHIASPCADIFAHLVIQGHLREMIVGILTLTLNSLYSPDPKQSKNGASIIAVFAKYDESAKPGVLLSAISLPKSAGHPENFYYARLRNDRNECAASNIPPSSPVFYAFS